MARLSDAVIGCLVGLLTFKMPRATSQSSRELTDSIFLTMQTQRTLSLSQTRTHLALRGTTTSSWCCDHVENNDGAVIWAGQAQTILKTVVMHATRISISDGRNNNHEHQNPSKTVQAAYLHVHYRTNTRSCRTIDFPASPLNQPSISQSSLPQ